MEYNRTVPISEVEWLMIQKHRALVQKGFGSLLVKVRDGKVYDLDLTIHHDSKELVKLQSHEN